MCRLIVYSVKCGNAVGLFSVQSAKILFVTQKYEIVMILSNFSLFQYCDSLIVLFTIAPSTVIVLDILCFIFCICLPFLFLYLLLLLFQLSLSRQLLLFLDLRGDLVTVLYYFSLSSEKSDNYCIRNSWKLSLLEEIKKWSH